MSGKINLNSAQKTEVQTASPSPPVDPESDVTSAASDGESDYVELSENSPTIPVNIPDLAGNTSKIEAMQEVLEREINTIDQPTVIFSYTNKLEIPALVDADTDPPENLQENGATPPVNTQLYPPHSTPEDTLVASANPLSCPRVKAGDAALQAHAGDFPDVHLLGADYMLYGIYQDWVHQNTGEQLDG